MSFMSGHLHHVKAMWKVSDNRDNKADVSNHIEMWLDYNSIYVNI